ncbi:pectate lyase [Singulisphaera sp. Ch08]|uniref:Pectate lyase n=1 Tax=Singulisphaera sp. Ch08 TaxID=3120278 RepID=A0AAU7CMV6_9BACT
MKMPCGIIVAFTLAGSSTLALGFDDRPAPPGDGQSYEVLRGEVTRAMRLAASFYRHKVASHGGYVYHYSVDLGQRWGEGKATIDQIWVQPPGTPTVGLTYLKAYEATGDQFYLDAAKEAGEALRYGQLVSGGWTNSIDFDPKGEKVARYRTSRGRSRGANNSTLDDGISQAAIRFMMRLDQTLGSTDKAIHESAQVAISALLKAQFPNGGFPQVWTGPVPSRPVLKASYPEIDWRTEGKIKDYWNKYTLNDGLAGTVTETLSNAFELTQDVRYKAALSRLGNFLILAQMPEPQPAWAQQYGDDMRPIWARRFEPAAVTGGESQDVLETLLRIFQLTGEAKYLEPIPRALAYLQRSLLPDGRLARYYELQTNKPLYMIRRGKDYTLTYDDSDLPAHYGWKVDSRLAAIEARYKTLKAGGREPTTARSVADLEREVRQIIMDLDDQGRWVSRYAGEPLVGQPKFAPGSLYLSSTLFSRNLETLSQYLAATQPRNPAAGGQGKTH